MIALNLVLMHTITHVPHTYYVHALIQWNLSIRVAYGPQICGCNREVAVKQRFKYRPLYYKWPEVGGCNSEVAALQSNHFTEVSLYSEVIQPFVDCSISLLPTAWDYMH